MINDLRLIIAACSQSISDYRLVICPFIKFQDVFGAGTFHVDIDFLSSSEMVRVDSDLAHPVT